MIREYSVTWSSNETIGLNEDFVYADGPSSAQNKVRSMYGNLKGFHVQGCAKYVETLCDSPYGNEQPDLSGWKEVITIVGGLFILLVLL